MVTKVEYKDGWYEIEHRPPEVQGIDHNSHDWHWAPRQVWCDKTFEANNWEMRNPINHYSIGPNGPGMRILSTTPLTWRFKREADATMFILKWKT